MTERTASFEIGGSVRKKPIPFKKLKQQILKRNEQKQKNQLEKRKLAWILLFSMIAVIISPKIFIDWENIYKTTNSKLCDSISKYGHWENWTEKGFSRKNHTYKNILEPDYPITFPPYKRWGLQNFSGIWRANDKNCKLDRYKKAEIANCLEKIVVVGDSRGRQLYRALKLYIDDHLNQRWDDFVIREDLETKLDNGVSLNFVWSNSFFEWGEKSHKMQPKIKEGLGLIENKVHKKSLIIIDQHLFWPIEEFHKAKILPPINNTEWVASTIIKPFKIDILPLLKSSINRNKKLKIVFLPAVEPIRPGRQENVRQYVRIYNDFMEKVLMEEFQNESRFYYLSVVEKMSMSPSGSPLVPDGTHWMWNGRYGSKYHRGEISSEKPLQIACTHVGLLDVLFNLVCEK